MGLGESFFIILMEVRVLPEVVSSPQTTLDLRPAPLMDQIEDSARLNIHRWKGLCFFALGKARREDNALDDQKLQMHCTKLRQMVGWLKSHEPMSFEPIFSPCIPQYVPSLLE